MIKQENHLLNSENFIDPLWPGFKRGKDCKLLVRASCEGLLHRQKCDLMQNIGRSVYACLFWFKCPFLFHWGFLTQIFQDFYILFWWMKNLGVPFSHVVTALWDGWVCKDPLKFTLVPPLSQGMVNQSMLSGPMSSWAFNISTNGYSTSFFWAVGSDSWQLLQ